MDTFCLQIKLWDLFWIPKVGFLELNAGRTCSCCSHFSATFPMISYLYFVLTAPVPFKGPICFFTLKRCSSSTGVCKQGWGELGPLLEKECTLLKHILPYNQDHQIEGIFFNSLDCNLLIELCTQHCDK